MALTASKQKFMEEFYAAALKILPSYKLNAIGAITAQAMNESAWGTSKLAKNYHNYFGMKCGSKWTGKSVSMATWEEYTAGTKTDITANFRAYDSMEEGIKGYAEFICNNSRYSNLLGVEDTVTYITNIKNDGWATDSKYISTVKSIYTKYVAALDAATLAGTATTTSTSTTESTSSTYTVGKKYTTQANMIVRSAASKTASPVGYNGLTSDGKKHDTHKDGTLDKGTTVTCQAVQKCSAGYTWIKCPSGWICAIGQNGKVYVK